jgi:hypothetical protein
MPFASSAYGQLRYISESSYGVIPGAGNGVNLRMTGPTMKAAVATTKSNEIRPDRLSTGLTRTDLNIDGGFNFELSGKEYDPFLEGIIGGNFAHYGTAGIGTTFTATTLAGSITAGVAPTTTSAFTNIGLGSWIKVIPPVGAAAAVKDYFADKWFKTHAVTAATTTAITLDASTPIAAPGIVTGIAGYSISQSVVSNGAVVKSFDLEYALTDVTQFLTFTGMRANSLELSLEVGSIITGSFGFIGAGHTIQGTTLLPGSPVASQSLEVMNAVADVGLIYENGTNLLGATSFIKSVKFNVSNNLRGQKAVGVYGNAGIGSGELEIGGSLEVYFQDATYYSKWLAGTTTSLALGVADAAGNGYLIEMDKVQFKDGGMNAGGRNDDVMLSLPFSAFYNQTTGRGLRITRAVAA